MNIIFLDIDGVLNMYGSSCRTFMKPYGQHIEPHLAQRLNYICENIKDLKIVISSSWRSDMDDLKKQLEEQGFKYWKLVIGKTCMPKVKNDKIPYPRGEQCFLYNFRGDQIKEWIDRNNFKGKYLVVDDEVVDICGEYCNIIPASRVREIDGKEGLLNKDALEIVKYFEIAKDRIENAKAQGSLF